MINEDYNDDDKYKAEIEERCNNMILTGEINNNGNNFNQQNIESEFDKRNFIHKLILNLDDFDCLVDKDTYNTYNSFFFIIIKKEPDITGFILDKMIILMIKSEKKMKFIIKDRTKDLLELTADFTVENGYKPNDLGVHFDYPEWRFKTYLFSKLLKQKSDEILDVFIKEGIENSNEVKIKAKDGKNIFSLKNDTFYVGNTFNNNSTVIIQKNNKFENINKPHFIGLANIGATCYMNATLQSLINTDLLTRYLLSQKNYYYINQNIKDFELTSTYCEVLYNVCLEDNIKNYKPKNFKEIISRKNPLFAGVQANDSKDLINFLLEEMHSELKLLENNQKEVNFNFNINKNDKFSVLNAFKKSMNDYNKSIISKLFYILIESRTHCQGCNSDIYNYEVTFYIEFPLENVYKFCQNNNKPVINPQNNKICIPLYECFNDYLFQQTCFTGENQIYCNTCNGQNDAIYKSNFFSFSPIIIIILNRGKGNVFTCDVDFPLNLDLRN